MVHRNVPNQLGIQGEHVKTYQTLLANIIKPSFQHHDIKDRGDNLKKKKVKNSGSLKSPETKHAHLSNAKRKIKQPGKPPPENNAATQRKLSPIRVVMDTTPNYMKSTTSSDARNDSDLQASARSPQTSDCKSLIRRNSLKSNQKPSSNSANKELIRNSTKSPSFKPIRTSAKKCSPGTLCENLQIQRATCSSTIKGHKFSAYVSLSPHETEAGGTSSMKVCPYSYCSLNGNHHHDVLPPLKSYLLAKRRILIKAQRNMKLGCLSPWRKKPDQENMEKEEVQLYDSQEHPPAGNTCLFQDDHGEYFVEIYSKEIEDLSLSNQDIADFSASDINISVDVRNEYATDDRKDQQSSLGDPPLQSFPENNHNIGVFQKVYTPKSAQGKEELDFLDFIYEMDLERTPSIQSEETDSEDYYDMASQAFEKPHPFEKLANSIKTQTANENEYHDDMSWKIYKVQKRSIGTQTDFEDQAASSMLNEEEEETQSIDGIDTITLLRPADKDANQTVAGENGNDNDNVLFPDEDKAKESGLNESVQDLAHPSMKRTQAESGTENKENQIRGCSPKDVVKINRIIKGNKKVIFRKGKEMEFKPKAPNFLSVEPDPDAEKVDLRHLTLDEKRNEDEWMVDYALQQALTKLATARKRKVALLVEAFETVTPTPNESRVKLFSTGFT